RTKKDVPSAGVMPDPEALAEEFENEENEPAKTLPAQPVSDPGGSLIKSPTAIAMMLFFGIQSSGAYAQMGWLPAILVESGVSEAIASIALAVLGGFNVIGGVLMPWLRSRLKSLVSLPVILGVV